MKLLGRFVPAIERWELFLFVRRTNKKTAISCMAEQNGALHNQGIDTLCRYAIHDTRIEVSAKPQKLWVSAKRNSVMSFADIGL